MMVSMPQTKLPLGAFPVDTKAPNWSASEPHYCKTAQATKATVTIPLMMNKLTTSARSSFSRATNSLLPHRAMLGANLNIITLPGRVTCAGLPTVAPRPHAKRRWPRSPRAGAETKVAVRVP